MPYVNYYLFRKCLYKPEEGYVESDSESNSDSEALDQMYYLRNSAGILLSCLVGETLEVYRGKNTTKILVKDNMLYHHLGEFFLSKTTGDTIHARSKKKRGRALAMKKKKRGYIVNPLARRLYYHNGWIDSWFSDKKYYSMTLHNVLQLRAFIYFFFKRKKLKLSGLLLSNLDFTQGLAFDTMTIYLYDGPFQEYIINDFKKSIKKGLFLRNVEEKIMETSFIMLNIFERQIFFLKKMSRMKRKPLIYEKPYIGFCRFVLNSLRSKMGKLFHILSKSRLGRKLNLKNFFFIFYWKNAILKQNYVRMVSYLKMTMDKFSLKKINVSFVFLGNEGITAEMLCRFIAIKLRDKYTVIDLFRPLKRELNLVKKWDRFFYGFKIKLSGRFARRDRSKFYTLYEPTLPLSTVVAPIDYYNSTAVLKNSICSIKVWLHRQPFSKNTSRFRVIEVSGEDYYKNYHYKRGEQEKDYLDLDIIKNNKKIKAKYLKLEESLSLTLNRQGLFTSLFCYKNILKNREITRRRFLEEAKDFKLDELDALSRYKSVNLKKMSKSFMLEDYEKSLNIGMTLLKIKKLKIYLRRKLNEKKS